MYIKVGYELTYDCPQPTPMLLMLNIHYSHANQIVTPDLLVVSPAVETKSYRDAFGNWCTRLEARRPNNDQHVGGGSRHRTAGAGRRARRPPASDRGIAG